MLIVGSGFGGGRGGGGGGYGGGRGGGYGEFNLSAPFCHHLKTNT